MMNKIWCVTMMALCFTACGKKDSPSPAPPITPASPVSLKTVLLNNAAFDQTAYGAARNAVIKAVFSEPLDHNSVGAITLTESGGSTIPLTTSFTQGDSAVVLQPSAPLKYLARYSLDIGTGLKSLKGGPLTAAANRILYTQIDSSRKFPQLTDDELLDKIQKQTFTYFWDFGHPVSGLARERNSSGETVTSGGSGFGVMAIVTGVSRNYVTRAQGLARVQTIASFLKNTAQKFHGAFPHWLNGTSGAVIPFSAKDDGADLVETAYLMQGLLTARQFFNGGDPAETALRADINSLWNGVEWDWFRQNNQNVLYWHWSPNFDWQMNFPVRGWNEALITYVLAASSVSHTIPATVYTSGWTANGSNGFTNGATYYGYQLPLGPPNGGPLFFEHYSFLGIDPNGLADAYANYNTQTRNHTLINFNYCVANPAKNYGYSDSCWGLTASDIQNGYAASSPTNDLGVIAPTAAISSLPYTPQQSMKAIKFYYYVLGDKLFKQYGFVDAFSLKDQWFADSFLAIDQGPEIVMIENYRSGLLWNLFTSCPEVKDGLKKLGFTAPYL